jgi:hypothetical protein
MGRPRLNPAILAAARANLKKAPRLNPRLHVDTFQFKANLDKISKNVEKELEKALSVASLVVMRQSMENCPVDTGFLRASAFRTDVQKDPSKMRVHVGHNAYYATYVHEIMHYHHPVGMAKFLERAIIMKRREILKDYEKAIERGMQMKPADLIKTRRITNGH